MNRNYVLGRMIKTEIWSPITSYYDNLAAPNSGLMYANTPWSGHYNVAAHDLGDGPYEAVHPTGLEVPRLRVAVCCRVRAAM